jgi:hypothetical protein
MHEFLKQDAAPSIPLVNVSYSYEYRTFVFINIIINYIVGIVMHNEELHNLYSPPSIIS